MARLDEAPLEDVERLPAVDRSPVQKKTAGTARRRRKSILPAKSSDGPSSTMM
jgi:hypothetical protein